MHVLLAESLAVCNQFESSGVTSCEQKQNGQLGWYVFGKMARNKFCLKHKSFKNGPP